MNIDNLRSKKLLDENVHA